MEKHVFDPFLTHVWSQNGPFSRHFGVFRGPKRVNTGSKWAMYVCVVFLSPGLPRAKWDCMVRFWNCTFFPCSG